MVVAAIDADAELVADNIVAELATDDDTELVCDDTSLADEDMATLLLSTDAIDDCPTTVESLRLVTLSGAWLSVVVSFCVTSTDSVGCRVVWSAWTGPAIIIPINMAPAATQNLPALYIFFLNFVVSYSKTMSPYSIW